MQKFPIYRLGFPRWPSGEFPSLLGGVILTQTWMLNVKKAGKFFDVSFLNFHIYFVSEQGNRFGAKVISLGYLGYLTFKPLIFLSFLKLSV